MYCNWSDLGCVKEVLSHHWTMSGTWFWFWSWAQEQCFIISWEHAWLTAVFVKSQWIIHVMLLTRIPEIWALVQFVRAFCQKSQISRVILKEMAFLQKTRLFPGIHGFPVELGTLIQHSTARTIERLYNSLPHRLQNIRNVRTDTFKIHLDRWLRDVPDTPKIGNYGASVNAETNSIKDQKNHKWWPCMCGSHASTHAGRQNPNRIE